MCGNRHPSLELGELRNRQINSETVEGWVHSGSFAGSILAGTLLGYLGDRWLGTRPWLLVVGAVLGAYSGFMRLWTYSKRMEEGRDR